MKHGISVMALIGALALGCATITFAEEPAPIEAMPEEPLAIEAAAPNYYPYAITLQEDGEQTLVVKEYRVPAGTAVEELEETTISRMGHDYALWGVSEVQEAYTIEECTLQKTSEVAVQSNIPEEAAAQLQDSITYEDNGYSGTLQLVSVTCGDEMQEDGTYKGNAVYSGTVSRRIDGDSLYTLIYAPVPLPEPVQPEVPAPAAPNIPAPIAGAVACVILLLMLAFKAFGKKKDTTAPAAEEVKPKVYIPSDDVVLGAGRHDESDD